MKKLFELHQKITLVGNEYRVLKDSQLVGYARQKRLAIREQFMIYADTSQSNVLATSKARSVLDLGATFDVHDDKGKLLAVLKKEFAKSLISSTWSVADAGGNRLYAISEKSLRVAIVRRLWDFIPFIGGLLPFPMRFHFIISSDGKVVGEYEKIAIIRDHYALHLDDKEIPKLDERVWMIIVVLLDAMQSR
jgi:uncharacterized protein YxjI